ncbi:MAG: sugar phosphate isomerase/epimerase, partial [Candidatus Omnitrophica bacterium]|nr:sugar phosphate isomerase/epimerase [Candidatus Omnitrophota bacterium]
MLAISTAWKSGLLADTKEMLLQIKEVGLDAIELGYNLREEKLEEVISLLPGLGIKVASVHNFCPLPSVSRPGRFATDYYRLSSLNERERKKAVECTKATIDTASRVSCGIIVMHAGTVEFSRSYIRKLIDLYNQGKHGSRAFLRLKEKILSERKARKEPYLQSLIKSLEQVLP